MTIARHLINCLCLLLLGLVGAGIAAADDPPEQTEPSVNESPLGRLFEQIFKGTQPPPGTPDTTQQQSADQQARPEPKSRPQITPDEIDLRAPVGRDRRRNLDAARRLLSSGQQTESLTLLRQLLDAPEDTLFLTDEGDWKSLHAAAEQLITDAGPSVRDAYVARFGDIAASHFQEALQSGHKEQLAQVTRRFLHTPAGRAAALLLAERFRDLGERAEADWWRRRAAQGSPGNHTHDESIAESNTPRFAGSDSDSDEWTQPFGGPRHQGRAPSADPILIERWAQPIAVRPAVADQVRRLTQDLMDNGRACLPSAVPLAVDGKLITRTLRGVSVFDAESGRLLWETAEGASVERLLSGEESPRPGGEPSGRSLRMVPGYRGSSPDGQPLTGLLFRDGVYGLLSSDGEQLFVLEDHATLSYRQPGYSWSLRQSDDPFERDWSTNRLTAYDLDTGRVRWRIGGRRRDEPFDPPLVGTLFLGPPVVDRNELFLIGERDSSLFLYCLNRRTGEPIWSHAISGVEVKIDQDLVRRWWPAQPAVGAGVIVCPTTQGWLVAVDRLEHRIRWAYRYIEDRRKRVSANRSRVASAGLLNSRWSPSAPLLTDRYVVFTPPELPDPLYGEDPLLACVDVVTGERLWRKPKESWLYLAGASGGQILLVGKEGIESLNVATSKRLWKTSFNTHAASAVDNDDKLSKDPGLPSGRGIIAGGEYLLPLQSGQLWFINLADGNVRQTMTLRNDDRPLGNLIVHQGRLFSVGPLSVRSFESREAVASALAGTDPQMTTTDRLRRAELLTLEQEFDEARRVLRLLPVEALSGAERIRRNDLLWASLVQLVRGDLKGRNPEFAELAALAGSRPQQLTVERLRADRLLARGQQAAAFDVYWEHAHSPRHAMVSDQDVSLRIDRWLAGRLQSLWESAQPEDQSDFDQRINQTVDRVVADEEQSLAWWAEVLRFHPAGARLRRALAERSLTDQRWAAAETYLRQIVNENAEPEVRSWAVDRLLQLLVDQGRDSDAVALANTATPPIRDTSSPVGAASRQRFAESTTPAPLWSEETWTLQRSPASYNRSTIEPMLAVHSEVPSVARMNLRVEPNLHRLAIESLWGESLWETPLQSQSQSFYNHTTGVGSIGQLLLIVHRGVLHAVSVMDREQLWRLSFDRQSASAGHVRGPAMPRQQELRTARQFVWSDGLRQTRTPLGMLAIWRPGYLAYFGRRTITLADPLTGKTLWTRQGVSPQTMLYGTRRLLYVVPKSPEEPYALRVLDGSKVALPELGALVDSAVGVTEQGLVTLRDQQPLKLFGWGTRSTVLRLVDPLNKQTHWSLELPDETRFARTSESQILAVTPTGEVSLIDCLAGSNEVLGQLDPDAVEGAQRWYVICEGDLLYLALNQHPKPGSYSRSYQSAPINGTLAAFDRHQGLLWTETVDDQNLVLDQLPQLPVLVFTAQRSERSGNFTFQQIFVEVRDKRTGRLLLDESAYITGGNVLEMSIDHARRFIDLKTYRDRLRLSVAEE